MHARDAAGRQVSLLNDDSSTCSSSFSSRAYSYHSNHMISQSYSGSGSAGSSPHTPELLRSDSYDSQMSNDPASPMTPNVDYYSRQQMYSIPHEYGMDPAVKQATYADSTRSTSYDDEMAAQAAGERPAKRYPCRYRDSHGCEKTFTTSGHASRHSKIHTAEKAVQCTFPSCQKKFTRADNMKQHLETHYKDKSRSSGQRGHKSSHSDAHARRNSSGRASSRSSSGRSSADQYAPSSTKLPLASPSGGAGAGGAWDMHGLLNSRPVASRTPSGLDALAMAVACQEGS